MNAAVRDKLASYKARRDFSVISEPAEGGPRATQAQCARAGDTKPAQPLDDAAKTLGVKL